MAEKDTTNPDCSRTLRGYTTWKVDNFRSKEGAATSDADFTSPGFSITDTSWPGHPVKYDFDMSMYLNSQNLFVTIFSKSDGVPVTYDVNMIDVTIDGDDEHKRKRVKRRTMEYTFKDENWRACYRKCFLHFHTWYVSNNVTFGVDVDITVDPFKRDQGEPTPTLDQTLPYDLTLKCGDESFPCHKAALAAHSSVFEDMFDLTSDEDKELAIPDTKPATVEKMLEFVYSNRLDPASVEDLYALANKFNMYHLRKQSMFELARSLVVTNALDVLNTFAAHGCEEASIEDYAYKFAASHLAEVTEHNSTWTADSHSAVVKRLNEEAERIQQAADK